MTARVESVDPRNLEARRYDVGPIEVLELVGELDLATCDLLRDVLTESLAGRPDGLVVDLTRVGFCDVGCCRIVLRARDQTRVALVGLAGTVRRLFDLLDPAHPPVLCRTVDEAVWWLTDT